jgi:hypothetical protein
LQNDNFNGKKHIEHIIHCLGSTLVAMRIVALFMTTDVSKLPYCSSFHSIMSYGVKFWGYSTDGKRLFTNQKSIRRMANSQEKELSGSLFKQFSTPPTSQ